MQLNYNTINAKIMSKKMTIEGGYDYYLNLLGIERSMASVPRLKCPSSTCKLGHHLITSRVQ